jgi:uncharacterized protein YcfJ
MRQIPILALALASCLTVTQAQAQITFFEHDGFAGRSQRAVGQVNNLANSGFNDRASSVIVERDRWEVCEDASFRGRCRVLRPGRYASLSDLGLNDRISSLRRVNTRARVDDERYAPQPLPVYDGRRRNGERLFQVPVTSVRAVVGPPSQRCWMEPEQFSQSSERGERSVGGGIVGALIGGILGHQIGGGTGRDIATVGGAVAGAAVGANLGRDNNGRQIVTRDVQHCSNQPSQTRPDYWDVSYEFRGRQHHVQMNHSPGATVTVNQLGEPRD